MIVRILSVDLKVRLRLSMLVPGAESVRRLATALATCLDTHIVRWVGTPPDDETDAIGWRLSAAPRYLFSVSTHAGQLPSGWYDIQVSIVDDSLENGEILFLNEASLEDVIDLTWRYHSGEVVERFCKPGDA